MTPSPADMERIVQEVVKRLSAASGAPAAVSHPVGASVSGRVDTAVVVDRIVTLNSLERVLLPKIRQLEVQRGAVVTPSARDLLRDKNIHLIETTTAKSAVANVWLGTDGQLSDATLRWAYSRGDVAPSGPLTQQLQWLENKLISQSDSAGLIVSDRPLRAAALANRRPAFRAAVIATVADLDAAHQQLQANLLVAGEKTTVDQLSAIADAAATLSRVRVSSDPLLRSHT